MRPISPGQKRWLRFRQTKRGWWSFLALLTLIFLSLGAELLVNSRALIVVDGSRVVFPTYDAVHSGREFGLDYDWEADYRTLAKILESEKRGWVLLPLVPYNPFEQEFRDDGSYPPFAPDPGRQHYLGTDTIGRDLLARLVYGFRTAILFSLIITAATFFVGTIVGCLMGYWGGWFDLILQRIIEVFDQVPLLYLVMILGALLRPDFWVFVALFTFFGWSGKTWLVRSMTYRERERDYVAAAKAMGASPWRIVTVHILPNVVVVLVTALPFALSGGIAALTSLDYLGFGLPAPEPSWGALLQEGMNTMSDAPWILASVVAALVLILVMIAFVGEALRDAFDPKKFTVYR